MPRANYRQFRFSDQELSEYEALADAAGVSLSEWVRNTLNVEVVVSRNQIKRPAARELSNNEIACSVRGCCLGSAHEGPCVPRHEDEETPEIREQNLIVLSRDDPEGFRNKIRELLKKGASRETND
mgnify:CR=1 FL=1